MKNIKTNKLFVIALSIFSICAISSAPNTQIEEKASLKNYFKANAVAFAIHSAIHYSPPTWTTWKAVKSKKLNGKPIMRATLLTRGGVIAHT